MCDDDAIRELKQEIAEEEKKLTMDGYDKATVLREFLRDICPHITKIDTDDSNIVQCSCCQKQFRRI